MYLRTHILHLFSLIFFIISEIDIKMSKQLSGRRGGHADPKPQIHVVVWNCVVYLTHITHWHDYWGGDKLIYIHLVCFNSSASLSHSFLSHDLSRPEIKRPKFLWTHIHTYTCIHKNVAHIFLHSFRFELSLCSAVHVWRFNTILRPFFLIFSRNKNGKQ